jgi:hypothetical protein
MTIREYFRFLSRSALGLAALFLSLAAAIFLLTGGFGFVLAGAGFLAVVTVLVLAGFVSGLGPKAAAAEAERLQARKAQERIEGGRASLRRLSALRLPPGEVASARDLVALEGGRFLDTCEANSGGRGPAWDASALAAIDEALDLVDAWLKEADETAIERRFGAEDAHPLADGDARVRAALKDKATLLVKGRDLVSAEPPAPDRIAIEEELK